jgi:hypothetical protein
MSATFPVQGDSAPKHSGRDRGRDSRRYRDSAAECLLAAQEESQPHCRKLHLSMAISWLSLARKYEAIERLFQGTDYKLALRREDHAVFR